MSNKSDGKKFDRAIFNIFLSNVGLKIAVLYTDALNIE